MAERSRPAGAAPGPDERSAPSVTTPADSGGLFGVVLQRGAYGNVETTFTPAAEPEVETSRRREFLPCRDGVEKARRNADPWWHDGVMRALRIEAASGREFEPHDLRCRYGLAEPDSSASWGAAFREAHRAGLIEPAGAKVSSRPERAGSLTRTWRGVR